MAAVRKGVDDMWVADSQPLQDVDRQGEYTSTTPHFQLINSMASEIHLFLTSLVFWVAVEKIYNSIQVLPSTYGCARIGPEQNRNSFRGVYF